MIWSLTDTSIGSEVIVLRPTETDIVRRGADERLTRGLKCEEKRKRE
jgi:hypothetical protein